MVFDRPKRAVQRPNKPKAPSKKLPKKVISSEGNSGDGPSPWLDPDREPDPDPSASFVEYLRWMREGDREHKDGTKVQILQMAVENADYRDRLQTLTDRTKLIAETTFQVKCPWRIRVGGHRGPESILLPAFDALGMPYIPSSTLRGVARTQAIRELMKAENIKWEDAEPKIAPWFGSLDAEKGSDRAGKIVFLDAYPLPSPSGGLAMDMANNIWKWEGDKLDYSPNPNPFLSLKEPTFLIGLRCASTCQDKTILERVKKWLIEGLQEGIGSQVNTGYGELISAGAGRPTREFARIEFSLEGQLIHGAQRFRSWKWNDHRQDWQMQGFPEAEMRPTAFKSMLRYWFRAFTLGVLEREDVQKEEAKLFGGINPDRAFGYLKVGILNGRVSQKEPRPNRQGKEDDCGEQEGTLILSFSSEAPTEKQKRDDLEKLYGYLTWFAFNMGGIGQGARRPCYSRKDRDRAPWYRGSTLYLDEDLWEYADTVQGFQRQFQERLRTFYRLLGTVTKIQFDYRKRKNEFQVRRDRWWDAVDANCEIIICAGEERRNKSYALGVLHDPAFKVKTKLGTMDYDGNLCGQVSRDVKASPVWIADLGDYQIVTVFGANQNPRKRYVEELKRRTSQQNYAKVFPLPSGE